MYIRHHHVSGETGGTVRRIELVNSLRWVHGCGAGAGDHGVVTKRKVIK